MIGGKDEARLQRRVRTTVGSTTLLTLAAYPLLLMAPAAAGRLDLLPYLTIVGLGSVVALGVTSPRILGSLTPQQRRRAVHAWTAVLLATVTGAIAFSGGSFSELHHLLALPLVFAAIAYPRRILVGLLALTVVLAVVAEVAAGSPFLPARTLLRLATVGGTVLVTSWLTAAHSRQLQRTRKARDEADRQAAVLHALARSAADVNNLDHGTVLDAVVATAVRIGYDGAGYLIPRHGGVVVVEHAGTLSPGRLEELVPEEEMRACLETDAVRTVVVDDCCVRCVHVVIDDRVVGALVGVAPNADVDPDGVGLRIIGAQAQTALTNAHRFRSTRELVDQLRDVQRLRHDLVSTASHELRTPATVIKGAAELLEARWDDLDPAQRLHFVQRVGVHAAALEHVLDQIARFVDLDAGTTLQLDRIPLDLAATVDDALARHEQELAGHQVVARLEPVEVTADADALGRALDALLDNIATHTPSGTTVRVVTDETAEGARLVLTDDGHGVPDEMLPSLLAPFARSGDVLTRGTRGVGLGLTFVDHTVRAHGGAVLLSTDGGFTVSITLPVAAAPTGVATPPRTAARPGGGRPLALVVEDDDSLRRLVALTLGDAGYNVRTTGDGRSALQVADAQRPDVVVLDVDLPGLDGREVARALRDDPTTRDVPLVMVTGSTDRRDLWTIWASGADALLTKPYDVEELTTTVIDLVTAGNGRAHAAAEGAEGASP